ncbi:FtsH protease activity modulator HflK [bacterium]|nr:FtsH protease activity modulator HflK [candidate division CSSED10-310 bacterium]
MTEPRAGDQDPGAVSGQFTRETMLIRRILIRAGRIACGIVLVLYLSTAVSQVKVQETGILLRFGRIVRPRVDPGICITWPWPVDRLVTVKTRSIETLQAGFGADPERIEDFERTYGPIEQMSNGTLTIPYIITGDKNVLHLKLLVNYQVDDPTVFTFQVADAPVLLAMVTQQTLLEFVSHADVDRLLTAGKLELRDYIHSSLNAVLEDVNLGVQVVSVEVRNVRPPGSTIQAFKDVINAQEESREMVHQAESYANRMAPEARAEAHRIVSEAEAYRTRTVEGAHGEAERFRLLATEYTGYPEVTRERLRQETIEAIFPVMAKYIVGSSDTGPAAHLRFMVSPAQ